VCGCTSASRSACREVEELTLERGVSVSYETIRRWCAKFGQQCANSLRRPRPGDEWHLDEVFIKIDGEQKYLWRAVGHDFTGEHTYETPPRRRSVGP
jgi:transposase-like protein